MKKTKFVVTGMTCSACSSHVERAVGKLDGVVRVSVNLLTGGMVAEYDEKALSPEDIVAAVEHAGYKAAPEGEEAQPDEDDAEAEAVWYLDGTETDMAEVDAARGTITPSPAP